MFRTFALTFFHVRVNAFFATLMEPRVVDFGAGIFWVSLLELLLEIVVLESALGFCSSFFIIFTVIPRLSKLLTIFDAAILEGL